MLQDTQVRLLVGSLVVSLIAALLYSFTRSRKLVSKGSAVLLTGPSEGGKTAIHSALIFNQMLPSHTSMQANISIMSLSSSERKHRSVKLIDLPGHPRLRDHFNEHLNDAKAVAFVVDATTIARNGAAVADSLPPSQQPPSLVILAHKYDLIESSGTPNFELAVSRVRTILERELDKRRTSQAAGVGVGQLGDDETTGTEMGGLECIGPAGVGFKFKDWEGGEIEILGTSVSEKGDSEKSLDGLDKFKQWLEDLSW
ncbi:hypothetical protein Clacol_006847 [Clathrus columnatus]|uniref:Signal recognition particle receptor subunit beta n=1 Tax=Clathrus columnatus TaxID=1419009 RepID=A0AAV5AHH2_9AGAM|nr:hypothetical protein Clacol_006847 [Clathrus columnatus]